MSAKHGHWRSPAKVNVCLRVVGRRADGHHLLDSIFLPIDLCDDVAVRVEDIGPGRALQVEVRADDPAVPGDASNLAARAARALLERRQLGGSVAITLTKRIPAGAGLGGGSSNAGAVLRGLNALLALGCSEAELVTLALGLGADVPFFLAAVPARVRGVGERIDPIPQWPATALVVVVPPTSVSTAWAFARYRESGAVAAPGAETEAARLAAGVPLAPEHLVNDLEAVVVPAFPVIGDMKARLLAAGATAAVMSGSGAAVIGVAPSAAAAGELEAALRRDLAAALPGSLVHVARVAGVG